MTKLLMITTIAPTLRAFLLPFAHHFRALGWQVDALSKDVSACSECLLAFDRVWDVEWSRNPLDLQNLLTVPQKIRAIVDREAYDIVHVHTPVAAFVTRYALKAMRQQKHLKVVYTAHGFHYYQGGPLLQNTIFLALEKLAAGWTDYLVVMNQEDEKTAKRALFPANRVHYMPGIGVDLQRYDPRKVSATEVEHVRQTLGLTSQTPLFLSIAEFIPRKRHRDLLMAFAKLGRPDVHLALAGTGPLLEAMQQLAVALGLKDQVHFLGLRQDIPVLIRASIATVLVSDREGLPRSVMESLCLETPVIGTAIRGTEDLVDQGTGLLVQVGNPDTLSEALAWILDHPQKAQSMGEQGRQQMQAYALERIVEYHERLYAEVLG